MVVLSRGNVALYLVEEGLVSLSDLVDRSFTALDLSSRNHNFLAAVEGGPAFFVKQSRIGGGEGGRRLEFEAACYRLREQAPDLPIPTLRRMSSEDQIVVVDGLPDAESLWARAGRDDWVTPALCERMGRALGSCHRDLANLLRYGDSTARTIWPGILPPVLTALWALPAAEHSRGQALLLATARRHQGLLGVLSDLAAAWSPSTLIHGDVKWQNCLADSACDRVLLVDWELCDIGDAAWDVAGFLQSGLARWIWGLRPANGHSVADLVAIATPPEGFGAANRAFWSGYVSALGLFDPVAGVLLRRASRFAGARLVQTAYETLRGLSHLTPQAILCLQLAVNVLEKPDLAAAQLFGIARSCD